MRKKIVAGNWKMNLSLSEAKILTSELCNLTLTNNSTIVLIPNFSFLSSVYELIKSVPLKLGAQNCAAFNNGAYTGEVSVSMLKEIGVEFVIVGHSERRSIFNEQATELHNKVQLCLNTGITPIFCVGESLKERENDIHFKIIQDQLKLLLSLSANDFCKCVIAYEPVWAIGTGITASPKQAQEMHAYIRGLIKSNYNNEIAESISILYGGSCNASNAKTLFGLKDVDGGLIGGAALKANDFSTIINSF